MPWSRFAYRFPRRLRGATNDDYRRMALHPSRFAPYPDELLRPDPWRLPTGDAAAVLAAFGAKDIVWKNGVPVAASLSGRAFVSGGESIFRATSTLRAVRLVAVDPVRGELPSCPILAKLFSLDLWGCQLGQDVRRLADSPHLCGLESLNLSRNGLTDAEAFALAESPHLGELRTLNVTDNVQLTHEGVLRLRRRFVTIIASADRETDEHGR